MNCSKRKLIKDKLSAFSGINVLFQKSGYRYREDQYESGVQERKCRYSIRKLSVGAVSMIVGAVVFGTSPVLAQEGASEQPLANETQLSGESSALTWYRKRASLLQRLNFLAISKNKKGKISKKKKIPKRLLCTRFGKCRNSDRKEDVETNASNDQSWFIKWTR